MSHLRVKTTYNIEGIYGSIEKQTLYAHHNLSCDIVSIYDNDGEYLFSFEDTLDNSLIYAIDRIANGVHNPDGTLIDGVEYMTLEEQKKCGM